jgi:hypothetical protein
VFPPRFVLPLWPVIDRLLQRAHHIRSLRLDGSGIVSVELKRYNGRPIVLDDGCQIKTGDTILELHMNNAWFKQRHKLNLKASQVPWEVLRYYAQDLCFLAEQMVNGKFAGVTALHGCTFLGTGARRLGFLVEELPSTLWKKWAQFYLLGIMKVYYLRVGEGPKVMTRPWELKEVWLSRGAFLKRYGDEGNFLRESSI